jgi:hypothetical protein
MRVTISLLILLIGLCPWLPTTTISAQPSPSETMRSWHDNPSGIPVTRWVDRDGSRPTGFQEWKLKAGPEGPFVSALVDARPADKRGPRSGEICVLVNNQLTAGIQTSLDQYVTDLAAEGYSVAVYAQSGGTPQDIRAFLQEEFEKGMVGVLVIGALPVPWYEAECWDPAEHEEFPCDLYYMDMDGDWWDADGDGLFDAHTGATAPEVWMGRLTAGPLSANLAGEIALLQSYFRKNHRYRTGQAALLNRALVYVDDDWEPWAGQWSSNVGLAYADRTQVSDPATTVADDYEAHLPLNYEAILLCAHSNPNLHAFKIPPDLWDDSYTFYNEIPAIDPPAYFYNLFACSNARYVEPNYMGGWYIFCDSFGLASIGSTKTGSMLEFDDFYGPFGSGRTYGQALADWFTSMFADGIEDWERCWFYGMTLCGDPTLVRGQSTVTVTTSALPDGQYRKSYSAILSAWGGSPPYLWRLADETKLPDGLSLDSLTGAISGVPTDVGDFILAVTVTDGSIPALADTAQLTLRVTYKCGDGNNDGSITIADAVLIITYVFRGGPAPSPLEAGDATGDGLVNVADAVHLVNYIFRGGPAPVCP